MGEGCAEHRANTEKLLEQSAESDARWKEERVAIRKYNERQDEMLRESARKTDEIIAELREARDERRAMIEALFRVIDRLPPSPPDSPSV